MADLTEFLRDRMEMTDVYQPVIIRELLLHNGKRTKAELAAAIAAHDLAAKDYYEKIVMRWPKKTLTKHGIVEYLPQERTFRLIADPGDAASRRRAIRLCEERLGEHLEKKRSNVGPPDRGASIRYDVLKKAHGKCQLCGVSSEISPIDIDHVIPKSKADKHGKVNFKGRKIDVNDRNNLQALCFRCNRAKRDTDQTDFRKQKKLVRDRIPEIVEASGRKAIVKKLTGQNLLFALLDKLTEEHAELLAAKSLDERLKELADISEVVVALARYNGADEVRLRSLVLEKRKSNGGFSEGFYLEGYA